LSDEEDNSWAEELTEQAHDEYYGEEEYGEENSPGGYSESPMTRKHGGVGKDDYGEESPAPLKKLNKKIIINVYCTEYDVVKKVAKKVNDFKLLEIEEDHEGGIHKGVGGGKLSPQWDITWHDLSITPDFLSKLEPYQKVSQFPGIYVVCRKNHLARNLMKMQRQFPSEYNFFPKTWLLPSELTDFRN
jgi:tubulin polyglutamylase TTLL6/13